MANAEYFLMIFFWGGRSATPCDSTSP
jgi:hypothetical protein